MMIRELAAWRRNVSALSRASASRVASALKITQVKSGGFGPPTSFSTVPPQPISRSSQWAPRQSTWRIDGTRCSKLNLSIPGAAPLRRPPHLPGRVAAGLHVVERLLVLEGVHAHPEAFVAVRGQLLETDQPLEWLPDQLLTVFEIVEELALEDEEAPVDPETGLGHRPDIVDQSVTAERHRVEALARSDAYEAGDLILPAKALEIVPERKIRQRVAIVGEKHWVVPEVVLDGLEALADVRMQTGVGEHDLPPLDVAAVQPDLLRAARKLEVIR